VNGEIVNIPSFQIKVGDVVSVREKSKSLEAITNAVSANTKIYEWLTWDNATYSGTIMNIPSRELIPETIKEQLIVELYSK
jgi:small subunit ribosomal protein S4